MEISGQTNLQSLIDEAKSGFTVTTERLTISNVVFEIVRPGNPDEILDDETLLKGHDELPWQPYWAQAWEAAEGMMEFLLEHDLNGKSLLDVGCGLGLTSAAALHQGACVVLGDNAPPALLFSRINTWPWREIATIVYLDWNKTRLPKQFDWIIGSDILYDRNDVPSLDRFFREHLANDGRLVLSDPSRAMTGDFLKELEALGWNIDISKRSSGGSRSIRIIELKCEPRTESGG